MKIREAYTMDAKEMNDRWWQIYTASVSGGHEHAAATADAALLHAQRRGGSVVPELPWDDLIQEMRRMGLPVTEEMIRSQMAAAGMGYTPPKEGPVTWGPQAAPPN